MGTGQNLNIHLNQPKCCNTLIADFNLGFDEEF